MRNVRAVLAAGLSAGLFLGCGGGGGNAATGPQPGSSLPPAALVGTWVATELDMIKTADVSQRVDLVALGATMTLTVAADGRYTGLQTFPGAPDDSFSGTMEVNGSGLTMTDDTDPANPDLFTFSLTGTTLVVNGTDETYDFDGDGLDEPALIEVTFQKS